MGAVKREAVHLHELADGLKARQVIGRRLAYYSDRRAHSALDGLTPRMAYEGIPMPSLRTA